MLLSLGNLPADYSSHLGTPACTAARAPELVPEDRTQKAALSGCHPTNRPDGHQRPGVDRRRPVLSERLGSDAQGHETESGETESRETESRPVESRELGAVRPRAARTPTRVPRPEGRAGSFEPSGSGGCGVDSKASDASESARGTLAEAGSDLLGERALATLRGPMSRGAVPLAALASRLGWARSTLGRVVVRLVGREDAVPFDLAAAATFDLGQSGLAELWAAGLRTFRRQAAALGPEAIAAAAERPEVLRSAVTAMLADSFRREATGRYRRAFLNATLLEAAALSADVARADRREPHSSEPQTRSAGLDTTGPVDPVSASAAAIVEDWRRAEAAADSVYRDALRFLLRLARRRVRPPWSEADLIAGLRALFDGYFLRALRDPEDYGLERLAEMLWEVALALSEPGFLEVATPSRSPAAVEMMEVALAEATVTGRLPTIDEVTSLLARHSDTSIPAPGPLGAPYARRRERADRPREESERPGGRPAEAPPASGLGAGPSGATSVEPARPPRRDAGVDRARHGTPRPFVDSAALWNACLEYLLAGRRELRALSVAVQGSAPAAIEELLRAVATVVDEHAALVAATQGAAVWGELERILAEMLASVVVPSARLDLDAVARVMLDAARQGRQGEAGWRAVLAVLPVARPDDVARPTEMPSERPESRSSAPGEG